MYAEFILSLFSMFIFFLINFGLGKKVGAQLENENSIIFFALYPSLLQLVMIAILGALVELALMNFSFWLTYVLCLIVIAATSYGIYAFCRKQSPDQALQLKLIRWILIYQTLWVALGPITLVRLGFM
ncbi:hypothetical protein EC844_10831 [Acinetobacter calcoaceticus]|uniref:Uncharacterized protein n=1 Tax=Acinetobacter calcoaceticus TaxID=471 RepID=A0A4R1XSY8_ACICA|nr:hypothetical protein EC844_10831 [Acinetobacter calcoaceticus]